MSLLPMASVSVVYFILLVFSAAEGAQPKPSNQISLGSSLSPESEPTSWPSRSGQFAFGFYQQGLNFAVGIWLVGNPNNTVVWTANRDDPPVNSNATLDLTKDGKLLLRTDQGEEKLIANATTAAAFASIFPTDTILGGQSLRTGGELVSSLSESDHSSGRFDLNMQLDGNLVLYPADTAHTPGDAYWSTGTFTSGSHLYLNDSRGDLLLRRNDDLGSLTSVLTSSSSINKDANKVIYRATLDVDGVFRLYSHANYNNSEPKITMEESVLNSACDVKSFCGFNSFCTFADDKPYCDCLPGSDFIDPNRRSLGCGRNFSEEGCRDGEEKAPFYGIKTMENLNWGDHAYFDAPMSKDDCSNSCLEDCDCGAALYLNGLCKKQNFPLRYVVRDRKVSSTAFLKVGMRSIETKNGTFPSPKKPPVIVTSKKAVVLIIVLSLSFVTCSFVALSFSGFFIFKYRVLRYRRLLETGNLGPAKELTLQLFSYKELIRATSGFKEELGKGSFGAVYKGFLYKSKKLVAVKRLEKIVEEGEREFQAEMRAIGRTHHRNLVRLMGYCAENSRRLLVYEYMSNGSLANLLFNAGTRPHWNERVRIALDVARAKLLMPDQTRTFTGVRGTRGYLAPEWQRNTPISVKADIYSYGIVLLEIVCCRKNMEVQVKNPEEIILSNWVYQCMVSRELDKLVADEVADKKTLERMVKVGLWCIQDEPALRPSMKSVVLILEGITDIVVPPCPTTTTM
ncbi:G-type lectin S-receptor-like serine/threonine-protein kinase LECRK1 [Vitis vinifera]|uniref:non-specific serine/threonine protein kinase n=1 Tax=Vitis vinifera TaxID=29760 RepID=A0A438H177_VITVI|nr:G-type lectin S-receptor-like serine/threonine-protein kinase LECRK1 [Vitis vinifera]